MIANYKGIEFSIENKLVEKLNKVAERVTTTHPRLDAVWENEGLEGSGKTNGSIVEVAYLLTKINRPVSLFFKTSSAVNFAANTEKQIIIIDEPSFESLASDHATNLSKDFLRLTSTMREKRHIVIINFAKFWKFPDFLTVDRSLFMIHFDNRQGKDLGRFTYIKQRSLGELWMEYQRTRRKIYWKLKSFGGRFTYKMEILWASMNISVEGIKSCSYKQYLKERDRAVASIGQHGSTSKKEKKLLETNNKFRYKFATMHKYFPQVSPSDVAQYLGINRRTLLEWSKATEMKQNDIGNPVFEGSGGVNTDISMADYGVDNPPPSKGLGTAKNEANTTVEEQF